MVLVLNSFVFVYKNRQIPKLVKEIAANKKQPDGKVQTRSRSGSRWDLAAFCPVCSFRLLCAFVLQISIGGLAQLMKQMPSFRKQVAQVRIT